MNRIAIIFLTALFGVIGCSGEQGQSEQSNISGDASVEASAGEGSVASDVETTLTLGDIVANNVIIDHEGATTALGAFKIGFGQADPETGRMEYTREFSTPTLAGPTIVYIFKSIPEEVSAQLSEHGIDAEQNTAYLLPTGADAFSDLNAFKEMQRIGPIDPALSNDELGNLFGLSKE